MFDTKPAEFEPAFTAGWETKLCTLAANFVVVSTERFSQSLLLVSEIITKSSNGQQGKYIVEQRQVHANVMANVTRNVSLGALALGRYCLRDAYASFDFLSNLEEQQQQWWGPFSVR